MATVVVRGQNAHWLTQLLQPASNIFLLLLPRWFPRASGRARKHVAGLTSCLDEFHEVITPKILWRIFAARPAAKRKILQATLQQMIIGYSRYRAIIEADEWHGTVFQRPANVHRRDAGSHY